MYPKLKPEAKALFIKLLGTLKQTTSICRKWEMDHYEYCANGVLGIVIQQCTNNGRFELEDREGAGIFVLESVSENGFPLSNLALQTICYDEVQYGILQSKLFRMNDSDKKTFAAIAEWVKKNL